MSAIPNFDKLDTKFSTNARKHPDGKYNFTLAGLSRFHIICEKEDKLYRQAKIELLEEKNDQEIVEGQPNKYREKLIKSFRDFISLIPNKNNFFRVVNFNDYKTLPKINEIGIK